MSSAAEISNKYVAPQTAGQRVEQGQGSLRGRRVDHQQGDEGSFDFTNLRQQLARLEEKPANTEYAETPSQPSIAHGETPSFYEEVSAAAAPSQPSTAYVEAPSSQGEVSAADVAVPSQPSTAHFGPAYVHSYCVDMDDDADMSESMKLARQWKEKQRQEEDRKSAAKISRELSAIIDKAQEKGENVYSKLAQRIILRVAYNIDLFERMKYREDAVAHRECRIFGEAIVASLQGAELDHSQFLEAFSSTIRDEKGMMDDILIPFMETVTSKRPVPSMVYQSVHNIYFRPTRILERLRGTLADKIIEAIAEAVRSYSVKSS